MAELVFGGFRLGTRRLILEGLEGTIEVRTKTLGLLTHLIQHRNGFVASAYHQPTKRLEELPPSPRVPLTSALTTPRVGSFAIISPLLIRILRLETNIATKIVLCS